MYSVGTDYLWQPGHAALGTQETDKEICVLGRFHLWVKPVIQALQHLPTKQDSAGQQGTGIQAIQHC